MDLGLPFLETIRESNRQARDAWDRFAAHRERVQALLVSLAAKTSSLCILGAGNLNDVCLEELLERFAEVHLVDVDLASVRSALERHGVEERASCRVHGPIDLTGFLDRLPASVGTSTAEVADTLVAALRRERCRVPGTPFDVVASTAVLTQLLQSVVDSALPPQEVVRVSLALRDKHLADLVSLTRPGGAFVLVTDVVSTATAPWLLDMPEAGLEDEMARLVAAKNFFTGTNPYRMVALLERDAVVDVELLGPWLWAVTPDRHHLTCAIVARRRLGVSRSGSGRGRSRRRA